MIVYKGFIKVVDCLHEKKLAINIEDISVFNESFIRNTSFINLRDGRSFEVKESFDEIEKMIGKQTVVQLVKE